MNLHLPNGQFTLSPESVWSQLYPGKEFKDGSLRKIYSDLYRATQVFLAIRSLQTHEEWIVFFNLMSTNEAGKAALRRKWKRSIKKLSGVGHNALPRKTYHSLIRHEIYLDKYSESIRIRHEADDLKNALKSLDDFYILKRLKLMCEEELLHFLLETNHQEAVDKAHWVFEQAQKNETHVLVHIYLKIYKMIRSMRSRDSANLEKRYQSIFSYFKIHFKEIATSEARELLNYCFNLINGISRRFKNSLTSQLEDIFQLRVESKCLFVDGHILPEEFKNRISFLLIHDRADEALDFFDQYQNHLSPLHCDEVLPFCRGCIHFYTGDFSAMRQNFQAVKGIDPFFNMDLKVLAIKALFVEDDPIPLAPFLEAFKKFVQRNRSLPQHRLQLYHTRILQFERLYRLLYGSRQGAQQLIHLRKSVAENPILADQQFWDTMFKRAESLFL